MSPKPSWLIAAGCVLCVGLSPALYALDSVQPRTPGVPVSAASINKVAANGDTAPTPDALVFTAPPRDSEAEGMARFAPVAEYLSAVLGRKVVYRHPGSWGAYQGGMQKGQYDLVFDGPHFNGWRVEKLKHNVLVKMQGDFTYVAFVKKDNTIVTGIQQLAGQRVCAHSTPNLGTLLLLSEFDNPLRQPVVVITDGYDHIYDALLTGKCTAAMLPLKHLWKFDKDGVRTRVIYVNKPLPQQAISAGPRLTPEEQAKIKAALLAPEAAAPTAKLREAYGVGEGFLPATNQEYLGLGKYLRSEWGYY